MAGSYCTFCGQRCFVLRVIVAGPHQGWVGHLATCVDGMQHDLAVLQHTHLTATNPITERVEASRV
jgi:hypothetical protein